MDEALSAIDEAAIGDLFALLRARLPETQIISIAHQDSVISLHARRARLTRGADGAMELITDAEKLVGE